MSDFDLGIVKNPSVYEQNRLAPHSDHLCYANYQEMMDGAGSSLRQSLNGSYFFHYAMNFGQMPQGFERDDFDVSGWASIKVPGHFETQGYGKPHYTNVAYPWDGREQVRPGEIPQRFNAVGSYVTFFECSSKWRNCFICFEGVDSAFALYLNGHYVGYATGSFTPSDFDLTPYLRSGQNRLAVRVFKYSSGSHLEDQDYWRLSGIFRGVYLYTKPEVYLEDIFVKPTLDDSYTQPLLSGTVKLSAPGAVQLYLIDEERRICSQPVVVNEANTDVPFSLDLNGLNLLPWSAEKPHLYTLICQVVSQQEAARVNFVCAGAGAYEALDANESAAMNALFELDEPSFGICRLKIGFRRFELRNGIMCLNGKRIVFHGVNRHEFSAVGGRCVPDAETYSDLLTMKRNNINAVRTSHYPNSSALYHFCDELGLYVIDETNLETHGTWQCLGADHCDEYTLPKDRPEWHDAVLARGRAMLERDKNHACILIWSCGNESYGGKTIFDLSEFFRARDPSRLVHYEGIFHDRSYNATSDIESQMYTTVAGVEKFLEEHPDKPFIMCEYTHAMGQSCGGMKLYTDLSKRNPRYQGGFIWDYKDQAFLVQNQAGVEYYAYGGDFDDHPTEFNFSGNGITYADGSETSKMAEVKYNYQDFTLEPTKDAIKITNYSLFTNTEDYILRVRLLLNGTVVSSYTDSVACAPGESVTVPINLALLDENVAHGNFDHNAEYIIQACFELPEDTAWAPAGYDIAFGEGIIFAPEQYIVLPQKSGELELLATGFNYGVIGQNFRVLFSNGVGGLVSYQVGGIEYLGDMLRPNFWRAPTDNDNGNKMPFRDGVWRNAGRFAQCVEHKGVLLEHCAQVSYKMQLATLPVEAYVTLTYSVYPSGQIRVDLDYHKAEGLPELPEFGVLMPIKSHFSDLDYYGRGSSANYPDRKDGYKLGYYSSSTIEEFETYLKPQESGNHCDTRYFILRDEKSDHGMIFSCVNEPFNFSALPWSPTQIEAARHPFELPDINYTFVKLSSAMMGVGGDDSWGAPVLEQFKVPNQDLHLSFVFQGF
ncbi:MAG TPA: DUF4981 domain-containing protein [Candidatus Anaerobiospirillum stercoravium]|nr:DUF4981 domain-containing protein [Candidatus Anaerobiospirillum stercoravium]